MSTSVQTSCTYLSTENSPCTCHYAKHLGRGYRRASLTEVLHVNTRRCSGTRTVTETCTQDCAAGTPGAEGAREAGEPTKHLTAGYPSHGLTSAHRGIRDKRERTKLHRSQMTW